MISISDANNCKNDKFSGTLLQLVAMKLNALHRSMYLLLPLVINADLLIEVFWMVHANVIIALKYNS